jgi:arylsulfatase A-like enzyme
MFTGRYPHELTAGWVTALDGRYPTLAEVLRSQGYLTAGFVANTFYCDQETGLSRGFIHYEDYTVSAGRIILSSSLGRFVTNSQWVQRAADYQQTLGRKTAAEINEAFLSWQAQSEGRPFFAFLNYFDAHGPYVPPEPFDVKFDSKKEGQLRETPVDVDSYDGTIAYLDSQLGALFKELDKRAVLDNTLVIITSDHGEMLGEHGLFGHTNSLYLPLLHVPLIISFPPSVPVGISIKEPVTLRDIPATISDLLKLEAGKGFPGASLARYWNVAGNSAVAQQPLLSEVNYRPNLPKGVPLMKGDMKSVVLGGMFYIQNGDGGEELYNLKDNPLQENDPITPGEDDKALERCRISLQNLLVGELSNN